MTTRDVFVKPLLGKASQNPEVAKAIEALSAISERSHLDPDVLTYPNTTLLSAYAKSNNQPLLYVPVQQVYMLDGLGPAPMASPVDVAAALAQVIKTIHYMSFTQGIGEIYFPCEDEGVNGLAQRHGFSRMDYEQPQIDAPPLLKPMPFLKMKVYR